MSDTRTPPPGAVHELAERAVDFVRRSLGLVLDYTPETLPLLDHYLRMAPVLVPHLADRPMIHKRYPNGVEEDFFFQHTVNDAPSWMRTADLSRSGRDDEKVSRYVLIDDPMGLLWFVNLGNIELNPWQSTASTPDEPVWVLLEGASAVRADKIRLAAYGCPICGFCAGPRVDTPVVRPCPPCLVDLRRLERRASEADRIRRAIEARAEAGIAEAQSLGDRSLLDRARDRRRWVRRLREAGPDDLYAALLSAFTRAFERWHAPAA